MDTQLRAWGIGGDPKSLWAFISDGGAYEIAFGIEDTLADFWPEQVFQDALLAVIAYREIEERLTAIIKRDRKYLWMRRLRWFALSLFKLYIAEKQLDTTEMLGSRALFQDVFGDFWKEAHRELISAHYDAVDTRGASVYDLIRSGPARDLRLGPDRLPKTITP